MYEALSPRGGRALRGTGGDAAEAVIMPKFCLKRLSRDRRETSSEKTARAASGDERGAGKKKKTTDFHQNRLSNQMGTVRELGQSGWGGTLIGQISTQTRH